MDNNLQSGNPLPNKWTDRSRIGIFLGLSREHASSVSLVLNPDTGLVSPQFHLKHDKRFETTNHPAMKNIGKWQGETQIHRPKATRPAGNKRRKTRDTRTPILPPGAEAIATNPPAAETNARIPQASEASDATPTPGENGAVSEGDELNEKIQHSTDKTADPQQREREAISQQRESESSTTDATQADPQGEAQALCNTCKRVTFRDTIAVSEEDKRISKSPLKPCIKSQKKQVSIRLKAHESRSQKRKQTRDEIDSIDALKLTCNLSEERKNELEHAIFAY